ncbi:MAG TPA: oligosaccharide flippase family protein, partial [Nitrososphaeraceae archaeon]|nr:oligosaccharide flippase family protein [Nitrososphaeraceae archaeon]
MSEATVTQKISHALSWSLLLRAITLISTLVLSVIIVRGLGSHDFGIFSLLRNIIIYAGIFCSFGLDAALLRFVPEQIAEGDWVGFTATVSKVLLFHLPLIMLTFVVFFLLRGLFANLYSNEVTAYLLISALIAGLLAYKNSLTQLFIALYRFRWLSIVTVASSALWIIFTFLLLRLGVQIRGVLAAQALSFFVLICMLVLGLRKQLRFPLKFTYSVGNHRLLAYSGTSLTNSVLNLIVQRQSEIFFVGYYLGTEAAGKYDLGYYLPQMSLEVISGIIWSLGIVGFSEAITRNPNKLGVGIRRYYKFLALLLLPIAIFGAGWADKIILLVYGEEMSVAGNLAQAFSIAHLLFFITV